MRRPTFTTLGAVISVLGAVISVPGAVIRKLKVGLFSSHDCHWGVENGSVKNMGALLIMMKGCGEINSVNGQCHDQCQRAGSTFYFFALLPFYLSELLFYFSELLLFSFLSLRLASGMSGQSSRAFSKLRMAASRNPSFSHSRPIITYSTANFFRYASF